MFLDIIFLLLLIYAFMIGYKSKYIHQAYQLVVFALAFLAGILLAPEVSRFFEGLFNDNSPYIFWIVFLLLVFLTLFGLKVITNGLEKSLDRGQFDWLTKISSGVFTALLYTLALSLFVWLLDEAHLLSDKNKASAHAYPLLEKFPEQIGKTWQKISPRVGEFINEGEKRLEKPADSPQ